MEHLQEESKVEVNSNAIKVLIADDDPMFLDTITQLVQTMGFTPQQAKDGWEAVETFQAGAGSFSLVILDVEMPRLGGIEAAMKIREMDPAAKVILCSGRTRADVWKAKPNGFILKSFLFIDLRRVVQTLLLEI